MIPLENEEDPKNANKGLIVAIIEEVYDEEASNFENLVLIPLKFCGLFTISHLENPFMKTMGKYFLIASSFTFTFYTLELLDLSLWILAIIGLCIGLIILVLELLKVNSNPLIISYEIISVFAAIGYISIFSGLIIDFITFIAYYFSIDEVILNSILLSAGNTIGDFFGNGALAKAGEAVMGGFATYSGQIFNNYVGFSLSIYSASKIDTSFDIFGLHKPKNETLPAKHYFLMCEFATVLGIIIFTYVFLLFNKFKLTKKMSLILMTVYIAFFTFAMVFGFLAS